MKCGLRKGSVTSVAVDKEATPGNAPEVDDGARSERAPCNHTISRGVLQTAETERFAVTPVSRQRSALMDRLPAPTYINERARIVFDSPQKRLYRRKHAGRRQRNYVQTFT